MSAALPARDYVSHADFHARGAAPQEAAARQLADAARAAGGERPGTCAPCLRAATMRGAQAACDCADALPGSARALLHAAGVEAAKHPWSTAVLLGPDAALRRRIAALAHVAHPFAGALADGAIPLAGGIAHLIVMIDALPRTAQPAAALGELRRVAAAGACLLANFPFSPERARTEPRRPVAGPGVTLLPTAVQDIGWDIVIIARAAGWARASLLEVWSDELGYARTFMLRATA